MLTPNASAPSSRFADEEEKEEAPGGIKNSRQVDKHYFDSRIVMITGEITHTLAERVCVNLFALAQAVEQHPGCDHRSRVLVLDVNAQVAQFAIKMGALHTNPLGELTDLAIAK